LFTDVEGSTKLLHRLGAAAYAEALGVHRRLLREAFARHGGVEVDTQGDAFFVAFPTASGALAAARDAVAALAPGPIRVRMGIHTGTPHLTGEGYVGGDVHRAARIAAAGHGGQVLVSSSTVSLAETTMDLRDLGDHRFKDLSASERIYQLGDDAFPPVNSLYRTNLPVPANPFVGRERELSEVLALLTRDAVRLVTLTGLGGTGKTRLALQAAAAVAEHYPDGVWWVHLAALRDPALVSSSAAQALGAKDSLVEHVRDRSLLLVFDNFEHLMEAAEELPPMLAACPKVRLLVTSRELLRLPGEHAFPVPPLEPREGTELFAARARAVDPTFTLTETATQLCARLEQLPLALELAAARVRLLSPEQLLERLGRRLDLLRAGRGVDPRQQTLRATIDWSHELLDEDEQRLFARLAVFVGGCTLESAEEVCQSDLDVLQSLVDKSLVRVRDGNRFWMLETIREYASERLNDSSEMQGLHHLHAEHFLSFVEAAEAHLAAYSTDWLDRVSLEHDNIRAALDWLEASGDTQAVLRMTSAVAEFWNIRGHIEEGRRRLQAALAADLHPSAARGKALNAASDLVADTSLMAALAQEALRLHRDNGDQRGIALALLGLGDVAGTQDDWATAKHHWEEAARLFDEQGDERKALMVRRLLAWSYEKLGDRENASALYESNLLRARAAGYDHVTALSLEGLAIFAVAEGRAKAALGMLREAYHLHREIGDVWRVAVAVGRFARPLAALGQAAVAARVLACGQALCDELGAVEPWVVTMNEETLAMIRAQLTDDALEQEWDRGRGLSAEAAVTLALRVGAITAVGG